MPVQVNREELLQCLESVDSGRSQREILEQSSCFVFQNGWIKTYNEEVFCKIPSPLGKEFTGAVQASKLLDVLRKLPEEELSVDMHDGHLVFTGKRRSTGIRMEAEISLPINQVEKPKEWVKLHEDFADALTIVQSCASADQSAFNLTCVHLHPKWLEACDDRQACRWAFPTGFTQPSLVRQTAIKAITSLGVQEFSETENWLHFKNPRDLVVSCRRYLDSYPDLKNVLVIEGEPIALPKSLVEAVDKAAIFAGEDQNDQSITVKLTSGKLTVTGQDEQGWYKESKKVKYDGKPMVFTATPKILMDLVKRHTECVINSDYLKVDAGSYIFATCLDKTGSEKNVSEPDEELIEE